VQYIDSQYDKYLQDETGLNRRNIVDGRVHCCFYFINPSGHGYVCRGRMIELCKVIAGIYSPTCLSVCACVRTLKGKRLQLSVRNLVHIYSVAVAQHALTLRSKSQMSHDYENRHGHMDADVCCGRFATADGMGLHVM